MFGKDAPTLEQVSEDEDWGPGRRKRRKKESDAANTLMTLHESEKKCSNNEQNAMTKFPSDAQNKRACFRLPRQAVEVVLIVFVVIFPWFSKIEVLVKNNLSVMNVVLIFVFHFLMECSRSFARPF